MFPFCRSLSALVGLSERLEDRVATDCVDSYDREHHDISMKYMKDKIANEGNWRHQGES
jgi:hypothetical protein